MKYTNTQIEESLKQAVEDATPNVLPQILRRIANGEGKGAMNNTLKINFNGYKKLIGIAAAFVLLVGTIFGYNYFTPQTTISFDVNPSIELKVNASEKVLSATALNDDAKIILSNMKLKNVDLDVAVNALIGSMVKNGYIDEVKNSILISVDSQNTQKGEELQQRLSGEVNAMLDNYSLKGAVLTQTLTQNETIAALAKEYNISAGKAALVNMLVAQNPQLNFKEVSALSINDINLLLHSHQVESAKVASNGTASTNAYIGEEKAKTIAFNHAGVNAADVTKLKIKIDYDDGQMVYEVDFYHNNTEYEYEIVAISGAIVKIEKENHTVAASSGSSSAGGSYIGEDKAKSIAYSHAGVKAADVTLLKSKLDHDDGRTVYEIEFISGGYKYNYDIDATAGTVIKSEKKVYGNSSSSGSLSASGSYIGEDKAKSIAYNHAGVKAADVTLLKSKLDHDDGIMVYEIEFTSGGSKYEYDINATTGVILKSEKKVYGNSSSSGSSSASGSYIGEDKAKSIAYNHAGVKAADVIQFKVKLDHDDGRTVYEIEFVSGRMEYEYEIDAVNGSILKYESERD